MSEKGQWKYCIEAKKGKRNLEIWGLWNYRGLIYLFAKRDFVSKYRQTMLGFLWVMLNPLLNTVMFSIVFGNMAKFPTMDNDSCGNTMIPAFLFYMISNILWGYCSSTVRDVSRTLIVNVRIMRRVYYPRIASPIASALSNQMTMIVRFLLFGCFFIVGIAWGSISVRLTWRIMLLPIVILQLMLLSLGVGLIISVLTVKYRDLGFVVDFGLQLWLYITPVVYGLELVPKKWIWLYMLNPLAQIMTTARYFCFGEGYFHIFPVLWSWIITFFLFFMGVFFFNRVEKDFIDII